MTEPFSIDLGSRGALGAARYASTGAPIGVTAILAHGAGAGHAHPFMVEAAEGLATLGLDVVTFNFPYMERGRRVPDPPAVLEAAYRSVIDAVAALSDGAVDRLVIGGKSMGGRIASQVAASDAALARDLLGLVFLGYPLHPPGRPDRPRAAHLPRITAPMLFVQGTRDTFGTPTELQPIVDSLPSAALLPVADGDHSFKVPKRSGQPQAAVRRAIYEAVACHVTEWLGATRPS